MDLKYLRQIKKKLTLISSKVNERTIEKNLENKSLKTTFSQSNKGYKNDVDNFKTINMDFLEDD